MEYNVNEVGLKIMERIQKEYNGFETVNVMVLGKTGVGKSTLINNMFNEKIADVGIGKPITKDIKKIKLPGFPLAIYDTPGMELNGNFNVDKLLNSVIDMIDNQVKSGDIRNAIHCIWYCISTTSHRFEQAEIDFLKKLLCKTEEYDLPVIVVLTQSFSKKDAKTLKQEIEKENLHIVNVVPVLAENYEIDDEYTAKAYGLDILSMVMNNVIPDTVKKTFAAIQKVNIDLKIDSAHKIVASAAALAAATGAIPIPFSDAAVLVPGQIAMIGGITAAFGISMDQGTIMALISSTVGAAGATVLGKTIVANLIKLIPCAGNVIGGVISSATAAALTSALGEAYIAIMVMVCNGNLTVEELNSDSGKNEIKRIFCEQLKIERQENGDTKELE